MRKLGKLKVSREIILAFLDYPDAIIRSASYDIETDSVDIILESLEMPRVEDGELIPEISPVYTTYQDALGHKVTLRERNV